MQGVGRWSRLIEDVNCVVLDNIVAISACAGVELQAVKDMGLKFEGWVL